jgi:hypothetical protein
MTPVRLGSTTDSAETACSKLFESSMMGGPIEIEAVPVVVEVAVNLQEDWNLIS